MFGIYYTLGTVIMVIWRTAISLHTFETSAQRACHIFASGDGKLWRYQLESFRLQQKHQKLAFSIEKLYYINNKFFKNVGRIK